MLLDAALTRVEKQEALITVLREAQAAQDAEIKLLREGIELRSREIDRLRAENEALGQVNTKLREAKENAEARVVQAESETVAAKRRGKRNLIIAIIGAIALKAIL